MASLDNFEFIRVTFIPADSIGSVKQIVKGEVTMSDVVCKFCGREYSNIAAMTSASCNQHPDGKGSHSLAR
jgi:hypothetical protein